ncbi:hypothetical protein [Parasphingorhabdus halotolerans]|uniref:Phage terminase small subunit n=1 Tax=Parasphingorhabdus halotolerans TaxID=2725558 RepID=A0A6H2DMM8_9SPHN|nr:hypothetical protein [Parasphingorhabdus halotolerans]QJB69387.1 hypothetical protein HF685_08920 [Parasphingorhabdus halotolerans]
MSSIKQSQSNESSAEMRQQHYLKQKAAFLEHLATTSHVANSAKAAGIPDSTLYNWRKNDPEFCGAWMEALAAGYELLELELLQRARGGVKKKIFYGGKVVGTAREYNDGMAFRLLMAHKESVAMTRAAQASLTGGKSTSALRAELDQKLAMMRERLLARRNDEAAVGNNAQSETGPPWNNNA